MLCGLHLGTDNNFLIRDFVFYFVLKPAHYVAGPAFLVSVVPACWCGRVREGKEGSSPIYLADFEIPSLSCHCFSAQNCPLKMGRVPLQMCAP